MRIDAFSYAGEQDMLECRLVELDSVVDRWVIVEADVTHGGNRPKPYLFEDQRDRFAPWMDRIEYVRASGLPDLEDAWSRELAQREWVWDGLKRLDASPDDVLLYGDVDEIPTVLAAKHVQPRGVVVFHQRFHPFAVDWLHPLEWQGTVAARVKDITKFAELRNQRMFAPTVVPDAGWHFSWVSDGLESKVEKMRSFCHPEIAPTWEGRLDECWETGIHVDGFALEPVEVKAGEWPRWITEGRAPAEWFRPRAANRSRPVVNVPQLIGPSV